MSNAVLVIIGPSGGGKSSVVRELHRRGMVHVHPTWTTRPRRPEEAEGSLEHRFVSEQVFSKLASSGFFLDTVTMFGLPYRYGLAPVRPSTTVSLAPGLRPGRSGPGLIDVVMLRAPLVARFARFVDRTIVYQIEDDLDRTHQRLVERGVASSELEARMHDNQHELAIGRQVADRVFTNDGSLFALVESVAIAVAGEAA